MSVKRYEVDIPEPGDVADRCGGDVDERLVHKVDADAGLVWLALWHDEDGKEKVVGPFFMSNYRFYREVTE